MMSGAPGPVSPAPVVSGVDEPPLGYDPTARARRIELIRRIESLTGASVVAYLTSDRAQLQAILAADAHSIIYNHLRALAAASPGGASARPGVGLILFTAGGITTSAWGLVNLIREFTDSLTVMIPYKAHSAGTLVSLGADTLYLTRLSQLSPVDPSLNSPYNPTVQAMPGTPPQHLPVSVEAVMGYVALAKTEFGIKSDEALAHALSGLTDKVHPLALGDVYRSREQIASMATRLLKMGSRNLHETQIREIVETLTKRLGSHDYLINRTEAKGVLGTWVKDAPAELDTALMELFGEYTELMGLGSQFSPEQELERAGDRPVSYTRAVVESRLRLDAFVSVRKYRRVTMPQPGPVPIPIEATQQTIISDGWTCLDGEGA